MRLDAWSADGKKTLKRNNPRHEGCRTKRFADGEKTAAAVPVVVDPVQVERTLAVVLVEIRDVAVAVEEGDRTCRTVPETIQITAR